MTTEPMLKICDGSGRVLETIPAESEAFLQWRKAWAKRMQMSAREVALVIHLKEPQAQMLVDTGRSLTRLQKWLRRGDEAFVCDLVTRRRTPPKGLEMEHGDCGGRQPGVRPTTAPKFPG